ncbi:MAG: DNA polymerase III subunit beta [Acidobacteria bacterium]|nr:DNA polymerase III subunit beta [Acidobacteriota bacterium]
MEFIVNKADLARELNLAQGVVEKKTTILILSNVLLEAADGQLTVTATDLELGVRCTCPARVVRPGSGTLPAKRFLDYVRLLPDAEVTVKVQENHWANITCGRSKTRLAGMSRESYPELPDMPEALAAIPASLLGGLIARTIFAIAMEETRFTINGSLLVLKPDSVTMVSTDGHRLAMVEAPAELPGVVGLYKALVPKKAMLELVKMISESGPEAKIEFSGDDNHLFFRLGDRVLTGRKLSGNFPDYERVLPKDHQYTLTLNREELRGSIDRVAQFADERSKSIRVGIEDNELRLFSSLSDMGESEEVISVEYTGAPVDIGFNAAYLSDFLRAVGGTEIEFHFRNGESAGELRPQGGEGLNYRYVVMPMRI